MRRDKFFEESIIGEPWEILCLRNYQEFLRKFRVDFEDIKNVWKILKIFWQYFRRISEIFEIHERKLKNILRNNFFSKNNYEEFQTIVTKFQWNFYSGLRKLSEISVNNFTNFLNENYQRTLKRKGFE